MTVHCIWNALNTDCRLARASQTWRFRPIPTGPSLTYRGVYDSFVREFSKPYRACLGVVPPSTAESPHDRNFFFGFPPNYKIRTADEASNCSHRAMQWKISYFCGSNALSGMYASQPRKMLR